MLPRFSKPIQVFPALDDIEARSRLYAIAAWGAAAFLALGLGIGGWTFGNLWVVALLCIVATVAERSQVKLSSELSESISLVPTLFAAVLFGPLPAMVVAAASVLPEFRPPYLRWASYTATRSITAGIIGVIADELRDSLSNQIVAVSVAALVGALVSQSLDAGFAALALRLRRRASVGETLRTIVPLALTAVPLYAPIVGLLAFAYVRLSPYSLPLFFVPALAAQKLFALYQEQRQLTVDLVDANEALEAANLSFASALVATLDARDRYTAGHSAAVAVYARDIAARMDLSDDLQRLVHVSGLVHDIGKVGLAGGLLEKPGALTLEERHEMERHSEIGERILANVNTYDEIASIVRHHHERMDGQGYPDGLVAEEIPLLARIIAVADAYNAMTSNRPYRDAMPSRIARLRLAQAVDTQFDTGVVAAFEAILASAPESYRVAASDAFNLQAAAPTLHAAPPALMQEGLSGA